MTHYAFPAVTNLDVESTRLAEHLAAVAKMPVLANARIVVDEPFSGFDQLWPSLTALEFADGILDESPIVLSGDILDALPRLKTLKLPKDVEFADRVPELCHIEEIDLGAETLDQLVANRALATVEVVEVSGEPSLLPFYAPLHKVTVELLHISHLPYLSQMSTLQIFDAMTIEHNWRPLDVLYLDYREQHPLWDYLFELSPMHEKLARSVEVEIVDCKNVDRAIARIESVAQWVAGDEHLDNFPRGAPVTLTHVPEDLSEEARSQLLRAFEDEDESSV
ncbi:hypothetical protein GGF32_005644 [Allomyces javanicus]|nr:hypothetical protein GGF32_005644 [Allomyces javanicus]